MNKTSHPSGFFPHHHAAKAFDRAVKDRTAGKPFDSGTCCPRCIVAYNEGWKSAAIAS